MQNLEVVDKKSRGIFPMEKPTGSLLNRYRRLKDLSAVVCRNCAATRKNLLN
jgi:hypothetical protein